MIRAPRGRLSLGVLLGTAVLYAFISHSGDPEVLRGAAIAFGFQLACWAGSMILIIYRNPYPELRVSDPGLLYLFWCALYLILPSIFWLLGAAIPWAEYVTHDLAVELLWMHGVFIACLIGGYLAARPTEGVPVRVDVGRLPSGWVLFLVPLVPLAVEVFFRMASGGGILPDRTYGENWFDLYEGVQASRGAGGLGYVWTQILSKTIYYPILIQGVGLGLIMAQFFGKKRFQAGTLIFIGAVILAMILLGSGARSGYIMVFLVGLILADLLTGPIPWRYLLVALVAGLAVFEFLGLYRAYRDLPFNVALSDTLEHYLSSDIPVLGEFTAMFSKEALVLQYVRDSGGIEGVNYLYQQFLALFPSQLIPVKMTWITTGDLASRELLGASYFAGGGVAGAMIGDCYRFAGTIGAPLMATLLGAVTGWTQRWLMSRSVPTGKTNLLRVALWACFLGWAFGIIRSDLNGLLVLLLYSCLLPLLLLTILLPMGKGKIRTWIVPLTRLAL